MARNFNGTADGVTLSLGALGVAFGPSTVAIIADQTADAVVQKEPFYAGAATTGATRWILRHETTGGVGIQLGASTATAPTCTWRGGWRLIAVTKATGTVAPRFHQYDYGAGTWTHENAAGTLGNSGIPATSATIGSRPGGTNAFNGDIEIAGVWDVAMTDDQVEALAFSLSPWFAAQPKGLWLLDQAATTQSVPDISGGGANQSALSGTAVATNHPPVWNRYGDVVVVTRESAAAAPTAIPDLVMAPLTH